MVEAALGLPLVEAGYVAVDLLSWLPAAIVAAVGVWWREDVVSDRLTAYLERLPRSATREPLTGREQLDAWARKRTLGLIDSFPCQVTPDLLLVLAPLAPRCPHFHRHPGSPGAAGPSRLGRMVPPGVVASDPQPAT